METPDFSNEFLGGGQEQGGQEEQNENIDDFLDLSNLLAEQLGEVDDFLAPEYMNFLNVSGEGGLNLTDLLTLNRSYQQKLREMLSLIGDGLKSNRELQKWLQTLRMQYTKRTSSSADIPRKLLETAGESFPEGPEDLGKRRLIKEMIRSNKCSSKWTDKEKYDLATGIRQQNSTILLDQIMSREPLRSLNLGEDLQSLFEGLSRIHDRTKLYQSAVSAVNSLSQRQLEMNLGGIDWTKLATIHVPTRSPDDCRIQWTTAQHPLISLGKFTADEKRQLSQLVTEYGESGRWIEIAQALGPNRTAWQCLSVYRKLQEEKTLSSGKWTEEEDRILIDAVQHYGTDSWPDICDVLDGRSAAQCAHRWTKTLDPNRRAGRWKSIEDAWLLAAVRRYGTNNWCMIQDFVPHRTDVQCRERYLNVLCPEVKKGEFSPEEDVILRKGVAELGEGHWSKIAALLPNRTDNSCRRRWMNLSRVSNPPEEEEVVQPVAVVVKGKRGRKRKVKEAKKPKVVESTKVTDSSPPTRRRSLRLQ